MILESAGSLTFRFVRQRKNCIFSRHKPLTQTPMYILKISSRYFFQIFQTSSTSFFQISLDLIWQWRSGLEDVCCRYFEMFGRCFVHWFKNPKYILIELLYLSSFVFLSCIATCIGTYGILWMKVVPTHFVLAVGFDPRSLDIAVWCVSHWTTVRLCEYRSLWLM